MTYPYPRFLADSLCPGRRAFTFSSPPPGGVAEVENLRSENPWTVLSCALARCQAGGFDSFDALVEWMRRYDQAVFWDGSLLLLAFAAPYTVLAPFMLEERQRQPPPNWVEIVSLNASLFQSMGVWAVREALRFYVSNDHRDVRETFSWRASILLEREPGPIDAGPVFVRPDEPEDMPEWARSAPQPDNEGFRRKIEATLDALVAKEGLSETSPIAGGTLFHLPALAESLLDHLGRGEDSLRTQFELLHFEANTGIDCSSVYRDGKLLPLEAAALVETFLASDQPQHFEPGVRYFFGHRIPD